MTSSRLVPSAIAHGAQDARTSQGVGAVSTNTSGLYAANTQASLAQKTQKRTHSNSNRKRPAESDPESDVDSEVDGDVLDTLLDEQQPAAQGANRIQGSANDVFDLHDLKEGDERLEAAKASMNRKERRRLANRLSARRARQRRIQQVEDLEAELQAVNQEHEMTRERLVAAEATLRNVLAANEQMSRRLLQCGVHPNEVSNMAPGNAHPPRQPQPAMSMQTSGMSMDGAQQVPTSAPPVPPPTQQHVPQAPAPVQTQHVKEDKEMSFRRTASGGFLNILDDMSQQYFMHRTPSFAQEGVTLPKLSFVPSIGDFFTLPQHTERPKA